ncbi:MAG: amidohydrolase family protein [SAR324 cluster bacterium]|nr:amidohydrolase family protein [SAR324 cluster bacterium]
MGRKDISDRRKPEILEHAYRVVAREGFVGATITKIAKEMGVNSGILIHYFKNKEELTLALVDYILEKTMESFKRTIAQYDAPPEHLLDALIDIYFDREIPALTRGSVFWSCYALGFRKPSVKVAIQNMYLEFLKTIIRYLEDAGKADRIKITDSEQIAFVFISMLEGVGFCRMTIGDKAPEKIRQTYQIFKGMLKELLGLPEGDSKSDNLSIRAHLSEEMESDDLIGSDYIAESDQGTKQIIDLRLPLPLSVEAVAERLKILFVDPKKNGLANYQHIYGGKWAESMGMTLEELKQQMTGLSEKEMTNKLVALAEPLSTTPKAFLKQLDENGVEWGMIFSEDNAKTADFVSRYPERLKGMALMNAHGDNPSHQTEVAVKEMGFSAVYASPYHDRLHADDPKFFPIYAKALELKVPVFIYTAMNYNKSMPMDIGHPKFIDNVAMSFPDLLIVASLGGWPWVNEMVGVARRHQNVFIDTSFHRPKHLATPDSGWGMLLQFANTLLQDQVLFGSGVGDMGLPLSTIINEMKALPLKESVMQKWLYNNAARLFGQQ